MSRWPPLASLGQQPYPEFPQLLKKIFFCPGWCGSVDRVPDCEAKGCRLDSQSGYSGFSSERTNHSPFTQLGHTPGLRVISPVGGAGEATTERCFSPSFCCPSPLKINKILKNFFLSCRTELTTNITSPVI